MQALAVAQKPDLLLLDAARGVLRLPAAALRSGVPRPSAAAEAGGAPGSPNSWTISSSRAACDASSAASTYTSWWLTGDSR